MRRTPWLVVLSALGTSALSLPALAAPPDPTPEAHRLAREGKHEEAAAALRAYLETNRFSGAAWSDLGFELHAAKKHEEAIKAFEKAAELGYSPEIQHYNLACANAMLGRKEEAFAALRRALEHRFADQETLQRDTDIDSLRSDPRFAELTGINPPPATGLSKEQQWAWDLAFMQRRMEQMHWDLYAKVSKAEFTGMVNALAKEAPGLSDGRVRARLRKLLARVGDGHTSLARARTGETEVARYPLHMFLFSDGLYVIGAPTAQRDLLGCKVLKIGSLSAERAVEAARAYCSVDNAMGYVAITPGLLANPGVVCDIGAAPDETGVDYTVKTRAGEEKVVRLSPESFPAQGPHAALLPGYTYYHEGPGKDVPRPLWLKDTSRPLRYEYVPEGKIMYAWFAAVRNTNDLKLKDFAESLFAEIEKTGAETLVLDVRMNGGGNTNLVMPLVHGLMRNERINQPGRLYVIIGRHTFSAAQNTVNMLEMHTNATFVGEPTGSRPNFVGESTFFDLPYSGLRVHCSSRYWQYNTSVDQRTWVQPQIAAEMSFADYAAGRDPCMEAVVKAVNTRAPAEQPGSHSRATTD